MSLQCRRTLLHAMSLVVVLVIAASYWYTPEISFTLALLSNAIVGINLSLLKVDWVLVQEMSESTSRL